MKIFGHKNFFESIKTNNHWSKKLFRIHFSKSIYLAQLSNFEKSNFHFSFKKFSMALPKTLKKKKKKKKKLAPPMFASISSIIVLHGKPHRYTINVNRIFTV